MPVMPGVDDPTVPTADPGKEQAAAEPHADIVARLLDYQRRLREETGDKSAEAGARTWTPRRVEPNASAVEETSDEGFEPEESAEIEPEHSLSVSDEESSEPPDARQLRERIDRLDETWLGSRPCSRCSKGRRSVIPSPDDISSAPDTLRDLGR